MYIAKCKKEGEWQKGEVLPYGDLQLSPASGILNYAQVRRLGVVNVSQRESLQASMSERQKGTVTLYGDLQLRPAASILSYP